MPLDPQVEAVLDKIREAGNPEYSHMSIAEARAWHVKKAGILDLEPMPMATRRCRRIVTGQR